MDDTPQQTDEYQQATTDAFGAVAGDDTDAIELRIWHERFPEMVDSVQLQTNLLIAANEAILAWNLRQEELSWDETRQNLDTLLGSILFRLRTYNPRKAR